MRFIHPAISDQYAVHRRNGCRSLSLIFATAVNPGTLGGALALLTMLLEALGEGQERQASRDGADDGGVCLTACKDQTLGKMFNEQGSYPNVRQYSLEHGWIGCREKRR